MMKRLVTFRPAARDDTDREALYIGQYSHDAAFRFMRSVIETADRLASMPGIGHARPDTPAEYRAYAVDGFPNHIIVYRYDARRLTIVRLMHGAQDFIAAFEDTDE